MAKKDQTFRLRGLNIDEVSFVDRGANRRRWVVVKRNGSPKGRGRSVPAAKQTMPRDLTAAQRRRLTPRAGMSDDDLRAQRDERSRLAEIEVLADAPLRFQANRPTQLADYADWVNLRLPHDTPGRARNALARFRQTANMYTRRRSAEIVYRRAVEAALDAGVAVAFDPEDSFDRSLPRALQERLRQLAESRAGSRKSLDDTGQEAARRARASIASIAEEGARLARDRAARAQPASATPGRQRAQKRRVRPPSAMPQESRQAGSPSTAMSQGHWPVDMNSLLIDVEATA